MDGDWRLVTANADGSGDLTVLRPLSEVLGDETKWSPDGQKIASTDGDGFWVINADGTGLRDVVARYSPEAGFAWSPDGGQLAFFEDPGSTSKTQTEPIGVCSLGVTAGSTRRSPGLPTEA